MSEVFISYARSTEREAERIAGALRALGYGVWRDEEIPAHRAFAEVIEERIDASRAVLVVWSADAAKSEWVQSEADRGRAARKLVQLRLDGTPLPMPFDRIQCADLEGWTGDVQTAGWRRVVASLDELVRGPDPKPEQARGKVARGDPEPVLAVLAFDNLSRDDELLYFSDGVSEEILQTVAQTTGLRVIGRSSSLQFRGAEKAAHNVAAELGCTHILDGSVRRSGDRVRIATSLVECAGQTTMWSGRFDRNLSDVFALQDEIAAAVAAALKSTFAPSANVGKIDPRAYDLYLRARASSPGVLGAFDAELLRQAVALAPGFAAAWSALALTSALQASRDTGETFGPRRAEAEQAAERALVLDPNCGPAHTAKALLVPFCGHFEEAEALFRRAIELSPNDPESREKFGRWLHGVGRTREASAHIAQAYRIDPLYHQGANWYAVFLSFHGRLDEAHEVWDRARARWPTFDLVTVNAIHAAASAGDWPRLAALVAWTRSTDLDTPLVRNAIDAARESRDPSPRAGPRLLERLSRQIQDTGTVSLGGLTAAFALGLRDEAFELADRASFSHLFERTGRIPSTDYGLHVLFNPAERLLREDRRFVGLCTKLGLSRYWASTGLWPDCADQTPYDFRAEVHRLLGA